ncbi:putative nucleoside-diphosphate-sugar epimerase [Astrocystis sublimbata]|nr:putative nucleoside-diphosphate-sugar epimerase [Astrocystis sublimbata]
MHLILTGATGLVGSGVLDAMIKMKDVSKISILSRRPVPMVEDAKDSRINVIIHKDFSKYDPAVLDQLKGAQGCVWALGISQTQVSKEEYVKITKDYALAASEAFQSLTSDDQNAPFNFVYVSGHGASTAPPGRFTPIFSRVKGETEIALAALRKQNPLLHASSVRPATVDCSAHAAIKPYVPTPPLVYRMIFPVLLAPMRVAMPGLHSPTLELGRFLTEMAMGKHPVTAPAPDVEMIGDFPILENAAFRRLGKVGSS